MMTVVVHVLVRFFAYVYLDDNVTSVLCENVPTICFVLSSRAFFFFLFSSSFSFFCFFLFFFDVRTPVDLNLIFYV